MNIFQEVVQVLFRERTATTIIIQLPTKLLHALDTYLFIRNNGSDEPDRDYIIGVAIAQFLQEHLVEKQEEKEVDVINFTSGRRQYKTLR